MVLSVPGESKQFSRWGAKCAGCFRPSSCCGWDDPEIQRQLRRLELLLPVRDKLYSDAPVPFDDETSSCGSNVSSCVSPLSRTARFLALLEMLLKMVACVVGDLRDGEELKLKYLLLVAVLQHDGVVVLPQHEGDEVGSAQIEILLVRAAPVTLLVRALGSGLWRLQCCADLWSCRGRVE